MFVGKAMVVQSWLGRKLSEKLGLLGWAGKERKETSLPSCRSTPPPPLTRRRDIIDGSTKRQCPASAADRESDMSGAFFFTAKHV